MAAAALSDVVVLELASGVAGPYAGRLLADLGAQVIKSEPPAGDHARTFHPVVNGESVFFNWLNAGKLGVQTGAAADERLVTRADIVVHDSTGADADALEAQVLALNPRAVVVSLSPYGRDGERRDWQTSELVEWATSGFGYIAGDPAREPLSLPGHQVEFHAGLHAAFAALAGLWHVRSGGDGQRIEISHQEAALSDHSWVVGTWTHQGGVQRRGGSLNVPCKDGFIYLFYLVPYPNLFVMIERYDLLEDESLLVPANWLARFPEIMQAFGEWARERTKQEIYHQAQELRIAVSPVNTMSDVANNPQLAAREWFGSVEAGGQTFGAPGVPYRLMGTPCTPSSHAPRPGEHTAEVLATGFRFANASRTNPPVSRTAPELPLAGLRVIEVTANWAGPIGGRHFADLGADVIKVELATRPATRGLVAIMDDPWPQHYNRAGYFNKLNRNKRDICLDLSRPEGRAIFLELVKRADVVLENNSARVMGNLGLGYEQLAEVNPGIIMCSMAGYGATGPERGYSAYGSNIETASGLASVLGYGPEQFFGTGSFYADPVTGNHGAVAMMAALFARAQTGRGQWIDMSLLEAVTPFLAQPFLDYSTSGENPVPRGNRSLDFAPQGVYQAVGKDCWLAVTVRDNEDWAALCGVLGKENWARDPDLATVEGRRAHHDEIDAVIAAWLATRDNMNAAKELQRAGVPAAPMMPGWQIFMDNHLNSRDFFVRISHPEAGTIWFPGWPWRFEKTRAQVRMHAPMFAEHNAAVFGELLGMDDAAIRSLYDAGITGDEPIYEVA